MPKPSQQRTIISTRAEGNSEELHKMAKLHGIQLLEFPLIKTISNALSRDEIKILSQLHLFTWIIFTSANGVHFFFESIDSENLPSNIKIAAIGTKTADALTCYNCNANYISNAKKSDEFAFELKEIIKSKDKVLWPTSKLAGNDLINSLKEICDFTRIDMYDTVLPSDINQEIKEQIIKGNYDLIYFFSSSAVHNFEKIFDDKLDLTKIKAACIGEVTAKTCRNYNIEPILTASKTSTETLFNESM